ncbi:MAG TPA: response regulator transcription factor [Dehalococcoidia bacterium]|nr:response regulator transcription factor [Dehalococcoidia bacterium]
MPSQTVLVVDDEARIVDTLRLYLEKEGLRVVPAYDGRAALDLFEREKPDLIILDLMLPELSGLEVCRSVRSRSLVPIIMLTARSEEVDKVVGLELGADDYVTKPFSPREVAARVRAVLRRTAAAVEPSLAEPLVVGEISIDVDSHEVRAGQSIIPLTPTEFRLLSTLALHPGRVYTRANLVEAALGYGFEGYDRTIDSHIKNLRRKLPNRCRCRIITVHGLGYKLEENAAEGALP